MDTFAADDKAMQSFSKVGVLLFAILRDFLNFSGVNVMISNFATLTIFLKIIAIFLKINVFL
jgi:hypothetical protein